MNGAGEFRRVLGAHIVSNFGSMLSRVAIPWLATLVLDASALQMGMLLVADVAAAAAGTLVLGVAVDRWGKRATMVASDLLRAAVLAALATLAMSSMLGFWMLVVASAANGLLTAAFEMARSAWMAQRVEAADLPLRNAQVSAGGSLSETVAFALGGWIYQWLGAALALVVDAVSYVVSALFLRRVCEVRPERSSKARLSVASIAAEAREGIRTIAAVPALRALGVIETVVALGASLAGTSYMIFVARDLAFDPGILGMIFAAGGIGSIVCAALAPAAGRWLGSGGAMALGLALFALGAACIPLAPGATVVGAALLIAHQIIGDGGHTAFDVYDRTLRQTSAAPAQLARVDAGIRTLGKLATLVGAIGGGALATWLGARFALGLSAALFAIAAAFAYLRFVKA